MRGHPFIFINGVKYVAVNDLKAHCIDPRVQCAALEMLRTGVQHGAPLKHVLAAMVGTLACVTAEETSVMGNLETYLAQHARLLDMPGREIDFNELVKAPQT